MSTEMKYLVYFFIIGIFSTITILYIADNALKYQDQINQEEGY